MKLATWNVNGLRSILGKGFAEFVAAEKPDVLCLQETKVDPTQLDLSCLADYHSYFHPAEKKGYSGTALFAKSRPLSYTAGIIEAQHNGEGRVQTAEFAHCYVVNCYTPNSQRGLTRLPYRMEWDAAFRGYLSQLAKSKPVLFCGDLNVAHREIDLANPKSNRMNAGFTDEERTGFTQLLDAGFVDAFRVFDQRPGQYTWWTYRGDARDRNIGWRLDYWGASTSLVPHLKSCSHLPHIKGSDHCPVILETKPSLKW